MQLVLEAAVNAMADLIVSFNIKNFGDAPRRFGLNILLPREALALLRNTPSTPQGETNG